jgi:DNA-binding GntR family transcriptional regulator
VSVAPPHLTKTELALHALRDGIRAGDLRPGQRLRVDDLTHELGMSPTPIREALRLLQADGLVDYRPHHGIVVAELSAEATAEVYRLRALLEPLAVELAVPRLSHDDVDELERLHERHARSPSSEDNRAWHWTVYEASGSALLNDFVRRLWEAFPWRMIWALPGRARRSHDEHEAVMEAIRRRDTVAAAELMKAHVSSSRETLLAHLRRELADP